jgi:hypothetical protein
MMSSPLPDREAASAATVAGDAAADCSDEAMRTALDINIPNNASAVVATDEIVEVISAWADHSAAAIPLGTIIILLGITVS